MAVLNGNGTLTAFGRVYTIIDGETDGITISGGVNIITGLDSDAYLQIDTADWYLVDGDLLKY